MKVVRTFRPPETEHPLLPSVPLINLPTHAHLCPYFAPNHLAPSPPGNKGAQRGGSPSGTVAHRAEPGQDALPFPPVDAVVPWQRLTPNSCRENTASEQLQSPRTSGHVPGVVLSSWGPRPKMCLPGQSQTTLGYPCVEPKTHLAWKSFFKKYNLPIFSLLEE